MLWPIGRSMRPGRYAYKCADLSQAVSRAELDAHDLFRCRAYHAAADELTFVVQSSLLQVSANAASKHPQRRPPCCPGASAARAAVLLALTHP